MNKNNNFHKHKQTFSLNPIRKKTKKQKKSTNIRIYLVLYNEICVEDLFFFKRYIPDMLHRESIDLIIIGFCSASRYEVWVCVRFYYIYTHNRILLLVYGPRRERRILPRQIILTLFVARKHVFSCTYFNLIYTHIYRIAYPLFLAVCVKVDSCGKCAQVKEQNIYVCVCDMSPKHTN